MAGSGHHGLQANRASQTLLAHADRCLKSAELYDRVEQPGSHALSRGSAFHYAAERMLLTLIERGEPSLYAPGHTQDAKTGELLPEDEASAKRQVASLTEDVVSQVRAEHPELHCTHDDWDKVRLMAFHWAVATPVDPTRVVAVERKFVLDVGQYTVSGKIDVAELHGDRAEIVDYKTSLALPGQEEFEKSFQHKLYATLLAFGQPVTKVDCPGPKGQDCNDGMLQIVRGMEDVDEHQCPECHGTGMVEKRGKQLPLINQVRCREVYPRYLKDDGWLWERDRTLTRTELTDFRVDLEALVGRVQAANVAGEWPATPGHHCLGLCPAPHECPLPAELRVPRGADEGLPLEPADITAENAEEWAQRWYFTSESATSIKKRLRAVAAETGRPIPIGTDLELAFGDTTKREIDWTAFNLAVDAADRAGMPRPLPDQYRTESKSTPFVKRRVKKTEEKAA